MAHVLPCVGGLVENDTDRNLSTFTAASKVTLLFILFFFVSRVCASQTFLVNYFRIDTKARQPTGSGRLRIPYNAVKR